MLTLESVQTKGKAQMRPPVRTLRQTAGTKCSTGMTYKTWTNRLQRRQCGFSTGTTSAGGAASAASQYVRYAVTLVGSPTGDGKEKALEPLAEVLDQAKEAATSGEDVDQLNPSPWMRLSLIHI